MRLALSGSYSLGKLTAFNKWVAKNPDLRCEEEPYRALRLYGPSEILFRDASTKLHNGIRMHYIDEAFVESLDHLDLLAFVPKSNAWPVEMEAVGIRPVDHAYRDEADAMEEVKSSKAGAR